MDMRGGRWGDFLCILITQAQDLIILHGGLRGGEKLKAISEEGWKLTSPGVSDTLRVPGGRIVPGGRHPTCVTVTGHGSGSALSSNVGTSLRAQDSFQTHRGVQSPRDDCPQTWWTQSRPGTQEAAAGHMGMGRVDIHLHFSAITKNLETICLSHVRE